MVAQVPRSAGVESEIDQLNQVMADPFEDLRDRLAALADLRNVSQLLDWDQQTMMPPRGALARAETVGTIQRISHEMFVSDQTGRLIEAAESHLDGASADSDEGQVPERSSHAHAEAQSFVDADEVEDEVGGELGGHAPRLLPPSFDDSHQ